MSKPPYTEYVASHDLACLLCLFLQSFLLTHCQELYASEKVHYLVLLSLPHTPQKRLVCLLLWLLKCLMYSVIFFLPQTFPYPLLANL